MILYSVLCLQKNSVSSTESRVFSLEAFNLEGNNLFRGGDLFGGKLDDASAGVQFSALAMQSEDQLIAFDSSTYNIFSTMSFSS